MQKNKGRNNFEKRFKECDEKFNTIFKLTSVASKIIRSDLTILKVNKALCDLLDYLPEEIEGTKILDHACEEYIAHWHHLQEMIWAKQVPFFKLKACLYRRDRTRVWVDVTTILYNDQGETFGFTVLDDISSFKRLEESQKRLNLALKYTSTAIWELDLDTHKVFRSRDHDEIFGYPQRQEHWSLESYYGHISASDLPAFKEALSNIEAEGGLDVQVRLNRPDGVLQWLNIKGKTETGKDGKAVKLIGVINDITTDKIIERHKDDFISIASHELKTPVTSLKGSVQMLQRDANRQSERTRRLVMQASKGINRISLIIDDLLNAGKNYRDQIELRKTNFNLFELVREIVDLFAFNDQPAVTITGKEDIMVHADSERIGRVLTNLISNAVKYAPGTAEIRVELIDDESQVKISVIDNGPGIVAEKIPLLFNRYYQADEQQHQFSGLGLGLFISANIINKHGGEIGVDSMPDERTIFWFTLPK
ncbi:PAS domain-containing sensor histidine kinase [Pedobacter sp. WC2501]|uniref:PAS domain-containing sensor histidine kinase n=1 Tax=Pedobacter sp. WC2501 TaxID=3461400 RepID=UPI0040467938